MKNDRGLGLVGLREHDLDGANLDVAELATVFADDGGGHGLHTAVVPAGDFGFVAALGAVEGAEGAHDQVGVKEVLVAVQSESAAAVRDSDMDRAEEPSGGGGRPFSGEGALPDSKDAPPGFSQSLGDLAVAFSVAGELCFPEVAVIGRFGRVAWAAVPKAAVDKHGEPGGAEDEVRISK